MSKSEQQRKFRKETMLNIPASRKALAMVDFGNSAWNRGVRIYACEFLDWLETKELAASIKTKEQLQPVLLNGAEDWKSYSESGCSLVHDEDIVKRLCTPEELEQFYEGHPRMSGSNWLQVQAYALYQACWLLSYVAVFGDDE